MTQLQLIPQLIKNHLLKALPCVCSPRFKHSFQLLPPSTFCICWVLLRLQQAEEARRPASLLCDRSEFVQLKKSQFFKKVLPTWLSLFFFLLFPGLSDNIHRIFVSYGSSPSSTLLWCPQRKHKQMINTNSGGGDHTRRLSRRTCSVIPAISAGIFLPEINTMWIRTLNQLPLHAVVDFVLSHQLSSPTAAVGRHADSPETSSLRWKVYSWEEAGTVCPCRLVFPAGTATRQDLTSRLRQVWMWLGSIYPPGALRK